MSVKRRRAIVLTPLIIFLLTCFAWLVVIKPKLIAWVKTNGPAWVEQNSPYKLSVKDIDLSLARVNLKLFDVQIEAKDATEPIQNGHLKRVQLQLNIFALLVGRISVAYIALDNGDLIIKIPEDHKNEPPSQFNLQQATEVIFKNLPKVPVEKVSLSQFTVRVTPSGSQKQLLSKYLDAPETFNITVNKLTIVNQTDQLMLLQTEAEIPLSSVADLKPENTIQISADSIVYDNEKISGSKVILKHKATQFNLDFIASEFERLLHDPKVDFNVEAYINLFEIHALTAELQPPWLKKSVVSGSITVKGRSQLENLQSNKGEMNIDIKNVSLDEFAFGDASISAQLKNNSVTVDHIQIKHPSGDAEVTQIVFEQKKPFKFKAHARAKNFDLQKLFISIGLKDIPVHLKAEGGGVCTGEIIPLNVNCQAQIEASNLDVKTDLNKPFSIVKISSGSVSGDVNLTEAGVSYKALARIKGSPFKSDGEVSFAKGFKMNFESDGIDLSKVEDIASLNLRGILKGKLTAAGTSSTGVINSDLVADQFEISGFKIGQIKSKFGYAKSFLKFENAENNQKNTRANGSLSIDLQHSEINGEITATTAELRDIMATLPSNLQVPFVVAGPGRVRATFEGPLDFWKLRYQLDGEFKSVTIFEESFTQAIVKINSTGREINFDTVNLKKSVGQLQVTGLINTAARTPEFQLAINSSQLRFEDIDYFKNFFQNTSADIALSGKVTQTISNPELNVSFNLKDTLFENVASPDSQGNALMSVDRISIKALLLGRQLQAQIEIPKNQNAMTIQAQIREFNPLNLLPLIALPLPSSDTFSRVSGLIDLKVPLSSVGRMTGTIVVSDFLLQRSTQYIKLQSEAKLVFTPNSFSMQPILMSGPDQKLQIKLENRNGQSFLATQARLSLRPFQFLVPFADNLSGFTEFQFKSLLFSNKVQLMGEGLIDQASLGLKGFNYPLNKTSAFFDFSQSKIIFSEINSEINQSPITATGFIDFKGKDSIVININADAPKLNLEFPPRYQTSGQAKIDVVGLWPPYTLRVKYLINDGLITDEFSEENVRAVTLSPNKYLPVQNLQSKKPSLLLDIQATFNKGLVVKNRILEGIVTGEMFVLGSADKPELKGQVTIEPGSKLFFKDKPFDVKTGKVVFLGGPEIKPEVFISADSRVSEYDINLLVKGAGQQLTIEPTSQPSLSRNDIFSLLALGYTATKMDQTVSSDLQQQQTGLEILANLSNQSALNKTIQEKLGLTVQLAPSIDSTRNIAVPKVVVSKQLSKKVNTSYSRPLTGDRQNNEIRLQWLFQPNWSLIMNYQNQNAEQNNSVITPNQTDNGIGGLDLEYKKEFK